MAEQIETLRWQYGLTWRLAELHLPRLTDEACLWQPAPGAWTVRRISDEEWRPDWADPEPDPAPPATIAWLTWHLIWWWSALQSAVRDDAAVAREDVPWPGGARAVVSRLEALAGDWAAMLDALRDADLERPIDHPWAEPRPLGQALAWANAELMKNVAEIGYVRLLFEAARRA